MAMILDLAGDQAPPMPFALLREEPSDLDVLVGKRVLLLEDEVFIAMDLRHEAEAAGAAVTYARTLHDALAAVRCERFDGAILDVTIGTEGTCEPVADLLRATGTPFVLHSGDLDRQGEVIAEIGAPIVRKPAEPATVIGALSTLMATEGPTSTETH